MSKGLFDVFGDNSVLWLIIAILVVLCLFNNDCGCFDEDSLVWIAIILLVIFQCCFNEC